MQRFWGRLAAQAMITLGAITVSTWAAAQDIDLSNFVASSGIVVTENRPNSSPSYTAARAGDLNGDGLSDLVFGSPLSRPATRGYALFGNAALGGTTFDLTTVDNAASPQAFSFTNSAYPTSFDVGSAGDFNGDGYDDLILPSWRTEAYIIFGGPDSLPNRELSSMNAGTAWGVRFVYPWTDFQLNMARGIGDINGDGCDDIVITASSGSSWSSYNCTWVIFGSSARKGIIDLRHFSSSDQNGFMFPGYSYTEVSPAGDFDGDGFDDFVIGYGWNYYLVRGQANGFSDITLWPEPPENVTMILPDGPRRQVRYPMGTVGVTGDFNADGKSDILLSYRNGPEDTDSIYVLFGHDDVITSIEAADIPLNPELGFQIKGIPHTDNLKSVAWAGDINGDGFADILIDGDESDNGLAEAGSTYVIYGHGSTPETLDLATDFVSGQDGFRVNGPLAEGAGYYFSSAAGDVNNDGIDDMIFATREYDYVSFRSRGLNYVVFGTPGNASIGNWDLWE